MIMMAIWYLGHATLFCGLGLGLCYFIDTKTGKQIEYKIAFLFKKLRSRVARIILKYYYGEETR